MGEFEKRRKEEINNIKENKLPTIDFIEKGKKN